jgi:hypothetical protein
MSSSSVIDDSTWGKLAELFPAPEKKRPGQPETAPRAALETILFVSKCQKWCPPPQEAGFATKSVAHRIFQKWEKSGLLQRIVDALPEGIKPVSFPPTRQRAEPNLTLEERQE